MRDAMRSWPRPLAPLATLLFLPLLAACASGGGGGGSPIAPGGATATYEWEGATQLSIDAGGQTLPVGLRSTAVLEARFRPEGRGTRVSLEFREWEARLDNPMAPAQTADVSMVRGETVFTLDGRGRPTVVSTPSLSGSAAQFLDATQLANAFFPRLPAQGLRPGAAWTDTIAFTSSNAAGEARVHQVVRYTAVGDTVVEGRTLLLIRGESDDRLAQGGSMEGMTFRQDLTGSSRHTYLWDAAAGILQSSRVESDLVGTMTVDAAGMSLGMSARGTVTMRRR